MRFDFQLRAFAQTDSGTDQLAVLGSDHSMNWEALQLAVQERMLQLQASEIPTGHPVLIYGHKEAHFVVNVLACISLQLPYIPIDINVPKARCQRIAKRSGSQVLLTSRVEHPFEEVPIIFPSSGPISRKGHANFSQSIHHRPEDPIRYIIFTSGSTGEPKGVQITASAVSSYLEWVDRDFGLVGHATWINQAPFSFDLSVYDLYISLHRGDSLVLSTAKQLNDPSTFFPRIQRANASVWVSTPSAAYRYLAAPDFTGAHFPQLHTFLFCGETLPNRTARLLLERFPKARVLNSYGPTEATVATTLVDVTAEVVAHHDPLPVGAPKFSSELLLEKQDPNDEWGEIIIVGNNVSIGYFEAPELNAQKFFLHQQKRAFRTGDLGKLENGQLFFGGRNDDQIKLNGFRIELGDISHQMGQLPGVKDAVVLPLKQRETVKRIIGILILEEGISPDQSYLDRLRQRLYDHLPAYMVPSELCVTSEFPYTTNHKVDRKALIDRYRKGSL
ncbi:MAG: AMP-binding protein [Salibacteraceae bacterium]